MQHLEIGTTDACDMTSNEDLARADNRFVDLDVADLVGTLDKDGLHDSTVASSSVRMAG